MNLVNNILALSINLVSMLFTLFALERLHEYLKSYHLEKMHEQHLGGFMGLKSMIAFYFVSTCFLAGVFFALYLIKITQ